MVGLLPLPADDNAFPTPHCGRAAGSSSSSRKGFTTRPTAAGPTPPCFRGAGPSSVWRQREEDLFTRLRIRLVGACACLLLAPLAAVTFSLLLDRVLWKILSFCPKMWCKPTIVAQISALHRDCNFLFEFSEKIKLLSNGTFRNRRPMPTPPLSAVSFREASNLCILPRSK